MYSALSARNFEVAVSQIGKKKNHDLCAHLIKYQNTVEPHYK